MAETQLEITPKKMILRKKPSSTNPFDSDSDSEGDNSDSILSTEQTERSLATPPTAKQTSPAAASFLNSISSAAKCIMSKKKIDFGAFQRKLSSSSLFDSASESQVKSFSTPSIKHLSNGSREKENVPPCAHVHVPSPVENRIGLENQSPQEMEKSLVHKAEEATTRLKSMMSKKFDFSALQRKLSSNALFHSDSESDFKSSFTTSIKHLSNATRDMENVTPAFSCLNSSTSMGRSGFQKRRDLSNLENQSPQELENSLVHKAEETTSRFKNCLKIAEEISQSGAYTLSALENQGEQITQTHLEAAKMEDDLSKGEKLLGSLGGLFSKPWTPKKTRSITGPLTMRYNTSKSTKYMDQIERIGCARTPNRQMNLQQISTDKSRPCDEIEEEMAKQDDAISDLSTLLGQIKDMAIDMGSELGRQNSDLNHLHDDVDELEYRVQGANLRGRRLLGK